MIYHAPGTVEHEVERGYEKKLFRALVDQQPVPPIEVLFLLSRAAMHCHIDEIHEKGTKLRIESEKGAVPAVTELECAAGLWSVIRDAIVEAKRSGVVPT